MLQATYCKYLLQFKFPAGTSRGILHQKETWFVKIWNKAEPSVFGLGECAVFKGLSFDDTPDYEHELHDCCLHINNGEWLEKELKNWPSIRFGLESALADLQQGGKRIHFPSAFTRSEDGIPVNGLIWMGDPAFMKQQVREKLKAGFRCIKFKVGALPIEEELAILRLVRLEFGKDDLEIRLDANGAFSQSTVFPALEKYADYFIHSIEQPIKAGNPEVLAEVCKTSPIPIALDEELIGKFTLEEKRKLLQMVLPSFIILKPALTGGFSGALEWIKEAEALKLGWWITSALESNIGLNAIAQWTYSMGTTRTQGLGTGGLFTNNIPSPLRIQNQELILDANGNWNISSIFFNER